jgi:superfamily II DNA or RNA helicase
MVAGRRRILVQLATGLGKTVLFAEVARPVANRGGQVLVIAHRDELLQQARDKQQGAARTARAARDPEADWPPA